MWPKPALVNAWLNHESSRTLKNPAPQVAIRADYRCEYCRVHQDDSNFKYHVEHIISKKHGGSNNLGNLAFACSRCNWKKGSDIGTVLGQNERFVPLFNPRKESWFDHFEIDAGIILPKSANGEATIKLLQLNSSELILERLELIAGESFP